ncbi:ABC transporter ATP-binding protein [Oceanobacter kriegii]|uniref:ABC transporter ATP-binding protein n=1 Tax=Oceanobacter kriegii TaxID=64972 RepID=UPI000409CEE4|nr:ABC transporter ATP-binding protein [Oceanobacter kriegii]
MTVRLVTEKPPHFLEFKRVGKRYGDSVVLENINTQVKKGEFITMVGASGCGKSTFLKMLSGQEQATRGVCLMEGQPISEEPDVNRGIVFQKYSVFPHLNVLENVILGLELESTSLTGRLFGKLFGAARKAALEEAATLLEKVGLDHAMHKYPHELSGGMQQRLAIAQALIKKPKVLLLDEPFGALDPGIRADMHQLILELWEETGTTIFMVTHDITEGFYLGTRLWVFDKVRNDPTHPHAWGATITYDLPIGVTSKNLHDDIRHDVNLTSRHQDEQLVS